MLKFLGCVIGGIKAVLLVLWLWLVLLAWSKAPWPVALLAAAAVPAAAWLHVVWWMPREKARLAARNA